MYTLFYAVGDKHLTPRMLTPYIGDKHLTPRMLTPYIVGCICCTLYGYLFYIPIILNRFTSL